MPRGASIAVQFQVAPARDQLLDEGEIGRVILDI
jgi:hypothetical protein